MTEWSIHTYTATETGLFVNSYLLETPAGVVVIDTNLLVSDIEALRYRLAALRKPLLGIFITHAHPDHFNGTLDLVRDHEVPVYATSGVAKMIREIADEKRAHWSPVYGAEWPESTYYPNTELSDKQQIIIDDMSITVRELGKGESHADSYLLVRRPGREDNAFIGDLAFHGTHPYTADGHTAAWLASLGRVSTELANVGRLFPGHGAPTGLELFAEQRRYRITKIEAVMAAGNLFDDRPQQSATERFLRDERHHLLIAYIDDAPVGMVTGVEMTHPDKGTEMFLYELGVDEPFRRRGVGHALVSALSDLARERDCYGMWVITDEDNPAALATYSRTGGKAEERQVVFVWTSD